MTLSAILRRTAALCSAAAAAIHFGVTGEHFHEWWLFGGFFLVLGAYQLWFAAIAWQAPSRRELAPAWPSTPASSMLWWLTRTSGLPVGPDAGHAEPFGTADLLCSLLEAVVVVATLAVVSRHPGSSSRSRAAAERPSSRRWRPSCSAGSGVALAAPQEIGRWPSPTRPDPRRPTAPCRARWTASMDGSIGQR